MDKRFLGILAAIVVIFVGVFALSQHKSSKPGQNSVQATNHVMGDGQKGVKLTEYGDYQCPICFIYYQPLKQAVGLYSKDINFQFRNLPLVTAHHNAFAGARAAEAADAQNKYWQMHDLLYERQNEWATSANPLTNFKTYAASLGLNVSQFEQDYTSSKVNDAINADLDAFKQTGRPQQTPTFFLDGQVLENSSLVDPQTGAPSAAKIAATIQAAIDKKTTH